MSQDHQNSGRSAAPGGAPDGPAGHDTKAATGPETNDRREFIRQSLGVAPLMLTLGGRSHGGGTSMHGTLWSSLGTKWKHKSKWFDFKKRRWHWSKKSGAKYRDRDKHDKRDGKDDDWRKADHKTVPARKDWDWDKPDDRKRRKIEADSKHRDDDWDRRSDYSDRDHKYDWREDDDWKRSEGLSPFPSSRSSKKD